MPGHFRDCDISMLQTYHISVASLELVDVRVEAHILQHVPLVAVVVDARRREPHGCVLVTCESEVHNLICDARWVRTIRCSNTQLKITCSTN